MKKFYGLVLSTLVLVGCGGYKQGAKGDRGLPGAPAPVVPAPVVPGPVVDDVQAEIDALLKSENDYRLGLGQTMLSNGLSCTLYTITGGDSIKTTPDVGHTTLQGLSQVATFLFKDTFNQPNSNVSSQLNVLPVALRPLYTNMYLLRCQGQIVVLSTGYYNFELASDDGSLLYIDGSLVIDNDNNHGVVNKAGMKYLRRGIHTFRLDYAQSGGGGQALILKANNELIEGRFYSH